MARFASGKLSQNYCKDLEMDSGPAEDEVDGCAVLPSNFCLPAGCSPRKSVDVMISRGFNPGKSMNNKQCAIGGLFQHEHSMVIQPGMGQPDWQKTGQLAGAISHQTKDFKGDLNRVREIEEKCDSCYNSGLTESSVCHSADLPSTTISLKSSKIYEQVTNRLGNLNIHEDHFSRGSDLATDKSYLNNFEDEAYCSEERIPSVQNQLSLTDEERIELMFCEQDKEGDTQAHLLLIHNKISKFVGFLSLVNNSAYLNIQNFLLQSLLHLCVILNLPEVVRKLVARGAEVDVRDRNGNTPLHIACERGHYDCVIALTTPLDHREVKDVPYKLPYERIPQDQDIKNYNGMPCLHLAAENDHINIVNHLITMCYADINAQEGKGGETILHQAVERSAEDMVKYLLLHRDLHLEATRYDGSTALQMAKGYENHRMVNFLVNAGADNTRSGSTSDTEDELMVDGDAREDFPYDDFRICGSLVSM